MEEETKTTAPEQDNDHQNQSGGRQGIVDFGSVVSRSKRGNIYTLTIIGQVEGHQVLPETAKSTKYEHVMPLLASLEQDEEIDGVLLLLNTVGGDIEAGLGIAEAYRQLGAGRRALHRRATGGGAEGEYDCPIGIHDDPPGANERHGDRRAPDIQLF